VLAEGDSGCSGSGEADRSLSESPSYRGAGDKYEVEPRAPSWLMAMGRVASDTSTSEM
jgi:hypothetical protein